MTLLCPLRPLRPCDPLLFASTRMQPSKAVPPTAHAASLRSAARPRVNARPFGGRRTTTRRCHVPSALQAQAAVRYALRQAFMETKGNLADAVAQARGALDVALAGSRRWPRAEFQRFTEAVLAYTQSTAGEEMIHRMVACAVSGLREYLELAGKRVPGSALAEADRLEVIFFSDYDPRFKSA